MTIRFVSGMNRDTRAMTFSRRAGCKVGGVIPTEKAVGSDNEFTLDIESTEKHCNVCDRPGVYVVRYGQGPFVWLKVRYCWNCLPAEERHYVRVNY